MRNTNVVRRIRDGLRIKCASAAVAQAICLSLNQMNRKLYPNWDVVTYVVEMRE